jgi:hypothetical protein
MTKAELELLRQIPPSGISFAPESTSHTDRHAFHILVKRARSLEAQGLIVADFAMFQHTPGTDPLAVFCSLTELGQLALVADGLMPPTISYTVDHTEQAVRVTARGVVTAGDHEAHLRGLAAAGLFGYRRLEDYRAAFVDLAGEDLQQMLGTLRELRQAFRPRRTAFVTAQDMFYGMLRMYEALAAPDQGFHVFLDHGEAEAWLGLGRPVGDG